MRNRGIFCGEKMGEYKKEGGTRVLAENLLVRMLSRLIIFSSALVIISIKRSNVKIDAMSKI
jgi:hypothetical protein